MQLFITAHGQISRSYISTKLFCRAEENAEKRRKNKRNRGWEGDKLKVITAEACEI